MLASNYKIGSKFKHINCGVIEVVEIDEFNYFKNEDGDTFKYIDDSMILYEI